MSSSWQFDWCTKERKRRCTGIFSYPPPAFSGDRKKGCLCCWCNRDFTTAMPPSCGKLRSVDTWGYVSLIAAALLLGVLYFRERVRSAAIRELAIQSGFHYLGSGVPRSLTLNGTPLEFATSIWPK